MSHSTKYSKSQEGTAFEASQSYIYGYPLVLMDVTRETMLFGSEAKYAINQFTYISVFPGPSDKDVVRPNLDTLYSIAWLDLKNEPLVLSVPNTADYDYPDGRYYLMPLMDAWTNVFYSPGARTTGTQAGDFLISGPNWEGSPPDGVQPLPASPTDMVWIIGRIQCDSQAQYDAVYKIQNGMKLTPLSEWGPKSGLSPAPSADKSVRDEPVARGRASGRFPVAPPGEPHATPPEKVDSMTSTEFFERLAQLMVDNPSAKEDRGALRHLKAIGVEPGHCDADRVGSEQVTEGVEKARKSLHAASEVQAGLVNGWAMPLDNEEGFGIGNYGTDYMLRAIVALIGLGANTPADAVYPNSTRQADKAPYAGGCNYLLHFDADELPPVTAFWSLTMYDARGYLVENQIDRYKLGSTDKELTYDNGSLDIYIQADDPGDDKRSNWLPAPASGKFSLTARLYWPTDCVLDGDWHMPGVDNG